MTWAVDHNLPSMQKIVLLMMANRFNEDEGFCWPSHELLAQECGMNKRSVIRQIEKLIELNLIGVKKTKNKNNMNNVNKYILNTHIDGEFKQSRDTKRLSDRESFYSDTKSPSLVTESPSLSDRESLLLVTESHPKQLNETIKETVNKNIFEILSNYGINDELAKDFIAHRKSKKAPITHTAMKGFVRESERAGISIEEAVAISIERNWIGFKSEWHIPTSGAILKTETDKRRYLN